MNTITDTETHFSAHVEEYYQYQEAVADEIANRQMAHAEGAWEDSGCSSISNECYWQTDGCFPGA